MTSYAHPHDPTSPIAGITGVEGLASKGDGTLREAKRRVFLKDGLDGRQASSFEQRTGERLWLSLYNASWYAQHQEPRPENT